MVVSKGGFWPICSALIALLASGSPTSVRPTGVGLGEGAAHF